MTSSVADSLVGRVIDGRYRIISHLADGGMASVYVAMDARLQREVALKIMRPGLAADDVFVERFRSEARSAARLSHPNVVAVYDQGEDSGDVFLAMELVEGKTLRDVIHEEAPLTARESLAILEPILEALEAAHMSGIIHRDVKPENVIVRRDGEVKVADFGLARAITNQAATSQTGVLLGTVSYLSPEQVERGTADPRSDVYAAGLLLFEMLTGHKAVTGDTPIQIAYKHVHGSIPAPSSVVPGVPPALDALTATATAVEPAERYGSAAAFVVGLRAVRRALTPDELDRRGVPVTVVTPPFAEHAPSGGSETQAFQRVTSDAADGPDGSFDLFESFDAMDPTDATELNEPARAAGVRPVLSGRPVHDDPPEYQRTTALPLRRQPQPGRRPRPWWLVAAVATLLVAGATWWFTAGPGGTTVVPGVVNQTLAVASKAVEQASLRADSREAFSEQVPKGKVMSAQPAAGTEVTKDSTVELVVSKGPERYVVPKLVGTNADAASATLSSLTLSLGDVKQAWSETVPAGTVISQKPAPQTSVKRGTQVALVVSKGREPIPVPNVKGATVDAATAAIKGAGLTVARAADVDSDTVPAGQVISQTPDQGTLFRGGTVTIVVSKGPPVVQVPNVVGSPVSQAEKALTDLGFVVQKDYPFGKLLDIVRVQSIPAGQPAPRGTTIVLTIV
ncbi:serine/threonine protein kinase [Intrasporangium oryzae NRRL B-24470]|uniref:non-specific serine/threonine protein kinase n=1 Tax=Intrasporangium oryzae NRRL B-24470 TaxID=1386089 RepID=W9G3U2_9MICO|nr:Stk1 family PASTA domain-containing Ser/Thr kinase [Intrasporangium oryzae]EWS99971.1 serine/threonine protein kinase [Intrasporangium oryzae NRRL B-24470]